MNFWKRFSPVCVGLFIAIGITGCAAPKTPAQIAEETSVMNEMFVANPGDIIEFKTGKLGRVYRVDTREKYPLREKAIRMSIDFPGESIGDGTMVVFASNVKRVYHRRLDYQDDSLRNHDWLMATARYATQGLPQQVASK